MPMTEEQIFDLHAQLVGLSSEMATVAQQIVLSMQSLEQTRATFAGIAQRLEDVSGRLNALPAEQE